MVWVVGIKTGRVQERGVVRPLQNKKGTYPYLLVHGGPNAAGKRTKQMQGESPHEGKEVKPSFVSGKVRRNRVGTVG